jgi:hypothetical protein
MPSPRSEPQRHLDLGVVIGIEHYPRFRSLRGAAADARSFHDWLCDERGGGVSYQNALLILSDPEAMTPIQAQIDEALVRLLDTAHACGGARRLYFYFSGHGAANADRPDDDVALLLTRWSPSLARLALSTERYYDALRGMGLFEEVVVFLDCARSLSMRAIGLPPAITYKWAPRHPTQVFVAHAAQAGQSAYETPDHDAWHGVFTRCLLSILRSSPRVRANELKDLLEREVESRGVHQRAAVVNGLRPESSFGRGTEFPMLRLRLARRRGLVVLRGGDLAVVGEHEVVEPGQVWELPLPVGLYRVEGGGQAAVMLDHDGSEVPHDV